MDKKQALEVLIKNNTQISGDQKDVFLSRIETMTEKEIDAFGRIFANIELKKQAKLEQDIHEIDKMIEDIEKSV